MLGVKFTAWPTAPGPESAIPPPDNASPLGGNSASPETSAEGVPVAGAANVPSESNVTPIRRRRGRGTSDQLPLFQPAGPAESS
jgi:hypothetical protein